MKTTLPDRRRYKRVSRELPLYYRDSRDKSAVPAQSLTADIGEGGISFTSNRFFQLTSHLVVDISLPGLPEPIKAMSKVAWIKKIPLSGQYAVGVHFVDMSKPDKARISWLA